MTTEHAAPTPLRIVFVRHGESESNVGDFINDDPSRPVALTARGIEQAEQTGRALAGMAFCHAYASEFLRARQTAERILNGHRLELHIDARLNERRSGLDGQPTAAFNDFVRPDPVHRKPPLGESFLEQMRRLQGFLDHIAQLTLPGPVLAVSHENPIQAVKALCGEAPESAARQHLANGGIVVVEWTGARWRVAQSSPHGGVAGRAITP